MPRTLLLLSLIAIPGAVSAQSPFVEDLTSPLVQGAERSIAALWGDYDDDGDLDLLVTDVENGSRDKLYRNEGGGTFSVFRGQTNNNSQAVTNSGAWVDLTSSGRLDLITSSLNDGSLFLNQGGQGDIPRFVHRITRLDDFEGQRSVDLADFDGDGMIDVLILRRFGAANVLVRNDNLRGVVVTNSAVSERTYDSASSCWGDVNNDGWPDLYVANSGFDPNEFFLNVNGVMQRVVDQPVLSGADRSQGCSWGDYDGDGDLDLVITNFAGPDRLYRFDEGVAVLVNLDGGTMTDSFGSVWGDVDNDGDLDLVIARVDEASMLFLNEGGDQFIPIPLGDASDGYGLAATLVDDDEDGDLDLFVTYGGYNLSQQNRLYRNTTDGEANWLEVDLYRDSGLNRFGVGAHVYAYATIGGMSGVQLRPMLSNSGRLAQTGYRVHFGLGDATVVDSLVVDWPQGVVEDRTVLYGVAVNQILTVTGTEGGGDVAEAAASVEAPASFAVEGVHPNPSHRDFTLTVRSGGPEPVHVEVLDVLGRRVAVLEGAGPVGAPVRLGWDGTTGEGQAAPSGLYVLRVRQGTNEDVVKVTLLR